MRAVLLGTMTLLLALPAAGQGLQLPNLGGLPMPGQSETPEQKRAFCQRVGGAAMRCGLTLDMTALTSCLVRSLPAQDSMRVAGVANSARGNAGALLSECGIGLGR